MASRNPSACRVADGDHSAVSTRRIMDYDTSARERSDQKMKVSHPICSRSAPILHNSAPNRESRVYSFSRPEQRLKWIYSAAGGPTAGKTPERVQAPALRQPGCGCTRQRQYPRPTMSAPRYPSAVTFPPRIAGRLTEALKPASMRGREVENAGMKRLRTLRFGDR